LTPYVCEEVAVAVVVAVVAVETVNRKNETLTRSMVDK